MLDEANFTADVKLIDGGFLEYKSWKKGTFSLLNDNQAKNQLENYIKSGDFEYVIDKQKLLKDGVLEPQKFVTEKFQKVFKENASKWFKLETKGGIVKSKETLIKMFGTDNFNEIEIILDDISSSFYKKTINVE